MTCLPLAALSRHLSFPPLRFGTHAAGGAPTATASSRIPADDPGAGGEESRVVPKFFSGRQAGRQAGFRPLLLRDSGRFVWLSLRNGSGFQQQVSSGSRAELDMRSLSRALRPAWLSYRLLKGDLQHARMIRRANVLLNSAGPISDRTSVLHNRVTFSTSILSHMVNSSGQDAGVSGPLVEYERRITTGDLMDGDICQVKTLRVIQRLFDELVELQDSCQLDRYTESGKATRRWWLWSRFISQASYSPVKGLYLYGGVGTGKTMLMDLFYGQLPSNWRKKRIHFHDFMLTVHSRLQRHKGVSDPLEVVAGKIADESILLCLDEFMVTDVADALILNRLFGHLFSKGVVLIATSNREPDNLYEGCLQRDLFLPFIESLKERCVTHAIGSSTDYRKMTNAEQGFYYVGHGYSMLLKEKFYLLSAHRTASPQVVEVVMGRKLPVPLGADGCAYFPFEDICEKPLGAADYFGLFKRFHTLALEGIPRFGVHNRTAAYRFVTLVDVMYESKARLLCTAEATPSGLFDRIVTVADARKISPRISSRSRRIDDIDLCVDNELGFAKDRTISRLTEINSKEYLEQHASMLLENPQEENDETSVLQGC